VRLSHVKFYLPPLILIIGLLVATLSLTYGTTTRLEVLSDNLRMPQHLTMTEIDPDATTLGYSWCYKIVREPPQATMHTKVTVKTAREEGESAADFLARHLARIAEQEAITPSNCTEHTYP
jgi:hypothetical protein